MRTSFRPAAVALVVAIGLTASGCATDDPAPRPSTSTSAAPLFASDEEALAAAEEAYAAYVAVTDRVFASGGAELSALNTVATGKQLLLDTADLSEAARMGYRSEGETTFEKVTLQSYSDTDDAAVIVYLCEDVSAVNVVDSNGVSVVSPDRPNRVMYEVTFDRSDTDSKLLVEFREPWGGGAC